MTQTTPSFLSQHGISSPLGMALAQGQRSSSGVFKCLANVNITIFFAFRKVIHCGGELVVEVYLLELTLSVYPSLKEVKRRKFSRADTVGG